MGKVIINYSEELMNCKSKFDIADLLRKLDISSIKNLEFRVLRQFSSISDEEEKRRYADNIIIANNLPICIEFSRIISNGYTLEQYISFYEKKDKYRSVYSYFEEFLKFSKVLYEKKIKVSRKNAIINAKSMNYRPH